jgi:hypothetical protein
MHQIWMSKPEINLKNILLNTEKTKIANITGMCNSDDQVYKFVLSCNHLAFLNVSKAQFFFLTIYLH